MKKLLFALVLALASVETTPTYACSCIAPGSDAEETSKSDAVFEGTVTAMTDAGHHTIVQITVSNAIKGVVAGSVVTVDGGGSMCGFTFERGKRYKVFALKNDKGVLTTTICSATRRLN